MIPLNEYSIFGTQFTASAVIVFLGHVLERWFPRSATLPTAAKRIGYWLVAAGSAVGVHSAYTAKTGTLVITGLSAAALVHGLWHWVQSVALQEFIHGSTKQGKS
ncbi:MAG: hypothetical protein E6H00_12895 [Bacillati bacterium ANGP1]|uniref:Uncharacterized protein n=1 Tax=Candidatus Segetimicrobium genomatis TaxID=2569760 RepID=A0A537JXU2_9BACT|nr:MAG: hypothetical protein E6H00_12895 [Terrabacteria group bacterium ANGP1]